MLIRSNMSRINEKPNPKFKKYGNDLKPGEPLKQSRAYRTIKIYALDPFKNI